MVERAASAVGKESSSLGSESGWSWTMALMFYSATVTILFCMWLAMGKPKRSLGKNSYKTMVVLGSGGHTAEMFKFLMTLPMDRKYTPRVYVVANSDAGSESTMEEFERKKSADKSRHTVRYIPRSRVVGQSYLTSIFTTLYSFIHCALLVWQEKPTLLLANGPGTCLPIIFCAWIYRTLGLAPCTIFLLESYACVEHMSLTAKLCKGVVDRYCVQWPTLLNLAHSHIIYTGRVPLSEFEEVPEVTETISISTDSYVLVTVGSTLFDSLIKTVDDPRFVDCLKKAGYKGLHVQYGKGYVPTKITSKAGFEVVQYSYKKNGWKEEIDNAALVIGHAGAGTILDSLEAQKPIIVVANDLLMSQHQTEIANTMHKLGHLYVSNVSALLADLPRLLTGLATLRVFPDSENTTFATELMNFLGAGEKPQFMKRNVSKRRSLATPIKAQSSNHVPVKRVAVSKPL